MKPQILRKSSFVSPRCLKTNLMAPKGVPNEHLGHPRESQNGPLVTQGGPKVDRNGSWDPFGTQVNSRMVSGRRAPFEGPAFLDPLVALGRSKVPFWTPGGVPKRVQNRHGEARSAPFGAKVGQKALPKGVPKWGRKSHRTYVLK